MLRHRALPFALLLALPAAARAQAAPDPRARDVARAEARRALAEGPIAGLSIAVVQNGRVSFAGGFGSAELDNDVPASEHTVYRINSITKAFTAALILQLAEAGKLRLDDALSTYLPEYVRPSFDPTLRQLLTHTAGIANYGGPTFRRWIRLDLTPRQWVDSIGLDHLYAFTPGSDWGYSNAGYELLGLIAEKVSGAPLDTLLRQRILAPARMTETYRCNTPAVVRHRALSYDWKGGRFTRAESWGTYGDASGRICSTVLDLARFLGALEDGTLLSKASLVTMRTPGHLGSGIAFDYGLGTRLGYLDGHRLVAHTGSGESWTSSIVELPERKLTVIALTNTDAEAWQAGRIALDILGALTTLPRTPPHDRATPAALVDAMVGRWRAFGGPDVEMLRARDHLAMRVRADMEPIPLLYQGGAEFSVPPGTPAGEMQLVVDTARGRVAAGVYRNGVFQALALKDSAR